LTNSKYSNWDKRIPYFKPEIIFPDENKVFTRAKKLNPKLEDGLIHRFILINAIETSTCIIPEQLS